MIVFLKNIGYGNGLVAIIITDRAQPLAVTVGSLLRHGADPATRHLPRQGHAATRPLSFSGYSLKGITAGVVATRRGLKFSPARQLTAPADM